ncbi:hypothetical protein [Nocardioides limicola]|uniref:hypothetical protein n=1 Tax=Nocardioides limicola TaxID=2803368 RepID=UPI00193BDD1E|nr:hypothetical protein [Nocardioides sp. DJM-14]
MDAQVDIPVETLRRAADLLLSHLEDVEGPVVAVDKDFFWSIPAEQRANIYAEPNEFTVSQLTESLQNIDRIVQGSSAATSYALVWLADVLRAAGEAVVQ